jgi:hypothetical protein
VRASFLAPKPEMLSMNPRPFARRLAAPRCRGGASSLLRLSSVVAGHWPSATALKAWAEQQGEVTRTASAPMLAPAPDASSQWFKRLTPSAT